MIQNVVVSTGLDFFLGWTQKRWVLSLAESKGGRSFPWRSLKEIEFFFLTNLKKNVFLEFLHLLNLDLSHWDWILIRWANNNSIPKTKKKKVKAEILALLYLYIYIYEVVYTFWALDSSKNTEIQILEY